MKISEILEQADTKEFNESTEAEYVAITEFLKGNN
tara:strand:- start:227 stop:331 length:105 start_codon:yes stop_codon:yes gene_type:complete